VVFIVWRLLIDEIKIAVQQFSGAIAGCICQFRCAVDISNPAWLTA
jgi:hypothetical protein